MGTIEPGKIANLVVMSADFTDPKSKARFAFIDGHKFELDKADRQRGASSEGTVE